MATSHSKFQDKFLLKKITLSLVCVLYSFGSVNSYALDANEESDKMEVIEVVGAKPSDYFTDGNASALRTNVPINELSKSAQIFNAEFIEDFQPIDIGDVATFASNVAYTGNYSSLKISFNIRGFDAPLLNDGLLNIRGDAGFETYNLDRVEVLKGADSLQYGRSNAGGLINLVRKLPKNEAHAEIGGRLSSLPGYSLKFDVGDSIDSSGDFRYRLVGVYRDEESIADYNQTTERLFVAPSITYNVNEDNMLTFWAEFLNEDYPIETNNPIGVNGEILIPQEKITSHPDNRGEKDHVKFGFIFESNFGDWTSNLKYVHNDFENHLLPFVLNLPFFADTNTIGRMLDDQKYDGKEELFTLTLNGEFDLTGLINRITFGGDYTNSRLGFVQGPFAMLTPMNIFDENFDFNPLPESTGTVVMKLENETKQTGYFIQNHIDVMDQLIISLGIRYDEYESEFTSNSDATTPQFGVVYKFDDDISAFANYSESFTPNTVFDINGNLLEPEIGKGTEIGIRYKIDETIIVTAVLFDIEKDNVAVPDPANPFSISIASGIQTSQGFEFDVAGNITEDWSIVASYGYTDTEDKVNNPGRSLLNTPKHTVSLFTQHSLAEVGLPNFIIGGGLRHIGNQYVIDPANSVELASATVFDLNVTYQLGPWTAILTVQNLGDKGYVESAFFNSAVTSFGAPRHAFLNILYDF